MAESVPASSDYAGAFALLAEMTRDFAASLDQGATLRRALGSIASHVRAEAGSLWMVEPGGSELVCVASVGAKPITGARLAAPLLSGILEVERLRAHAPARRTAFVTVLDASTAELVRFEERAVEGPDAVDGVRAYDAALSDILARFVADLAGRP